MNMLKLQWPRLLSALAFLAIATMPMAQERDAVSDAPPKNHKSAPSASEASANERSAMRSGNDGKGSRGIRPESVQAVPTYSLSPEIWTRTDVYTVGDQVEFFFSCDQDAYIYIFNTGAAGRQAQLFPNYWDQANKIRGGRVYKIPTYSPDDYNFTVVPPAGVESVTILAVADRYKPVEPYHSYNPRNIFPEGVPTPFDMMNMLRDSGGNSSGGKQGRLAVVPNAPPPPDYRYGCATLYIETREPVREGKVSITSQPEGALVYVDDLFRGYAPLTLSLPDGECEIALQRERFRDDRHAVRVRAGRILDVHRVLKPIHPAPPPRYGLVWVDAGVDGAEVFLDGELVGEAPIAFAAAKGRREVSIQKRGYQTETRRIDVSDGETAFVETDLKRR